MLQKTFFPPYLDEGSRDLGPLGPVRFLQLLLIANMAPVARALGLVPDGDYGNRTKALVSFLQYLAVEEMEITSEGVDGNFGPATRAYIAGRWHLAVDELPSGEGGECMYMAPGFEEPQLWPPREATAPEEISPEAAFVAAAFEAATGKGTGGTAGESVGETPGDPAAEASAEMGVVFPGDLPTDENATTV